MSDGDCCMLCCCCCSLFSLCNTTVGAHPFCFPRSCFKCRRSKFDDDEFINEVVKDNEQQRPAVPLGPDPEATYHAKQPEPVMRMSTQYPPRRSLSEQQQEPVNKPQPEIPRGGGSSLERGGLHEEN